MRIRFLCTIIVTLCFILPKAAPLFACSLCSLYGFEKNICELPDELQAMITKELLARKPELLYPLIITKPLCTLEHHSATVKNVAFVDDHTLISSSFDKQVCCWKIQNNELKAFFPTLDSSYQLYGGQFSCMAISQDRKMIATSDTEGTDIKIWKLKKFLKRKQAKCIATLRGHKGPSLFLKFTEDSKKLLSAACDGRARVWDIANAECLIELWHGVPRKRTERNVRQEQIRNPTVMVKLTNRLPLVITSIDMSKDQSKIITTSRENSLYIWQIEKTEGIKQVDFPGSSDAVLLDEIPIVGSDLISEKDYGYVREAYFIDSDTHVLLCSASNIVYLMDLATKKITELETLPQSQNGGIASLCCDPVAKTFVSSCDNNTLALYNLSTMRCSAIFQGHKDAVLNADQNHEHTLIASASKDKTIKVWQVPPPFNYLTIKQILFIQYISDLHKSFIGQNEGVTLVAISDQDLKKDLASAFASFNFSQQLAIISTFFRTLYLLNIIVDIDIQSNLNQAS